MHVSFSATGENTKSRNTDLEGSPLTRDETGRTTRIKARAGKCKRVVRSGLRKGGREPPIGLEWGWGTGRRLVSQQQLAGPLGRIGVATPGGFGVYWKGQNSEA